MKSEKKKSKKKLIISIIVLLIILCIVLGIFINKNKKINDTQEENEKPTEVEEVAVQVTGKAAEEKETKDYKISNITISAKESETEILLTIKNIANKATPERDVYIKYVDSENQEIGKTRIHLPKMEKDKELSLSTIITKDLKNAADYIIEY